jgi:hypothetical protein
MAVLAQDADRRHVELQGAGDGDVDADPGDRDGAEDVAVCEGDDAADAWRG